MRDVDIPPSLTVLYLSKVLMGVVGDSKGEGISPPIMLLHFRLVTELRWITLTYDQQAAQLYC